MRAKKLLACATSALAGVTFTTAPLLAAPSFGGPSTTTQIKHVVVIFQENVSFDHYFATYPGASNQNSAEPRFVAAAGTPSVNGLLAAGLLTNNPNFNGTIGNPFRITRAQEATCDQDHNYTDEQAAFDLGLMDNFLAAVDLDCTPGGGNGNDSDLGHPKDLVMGYYDGNTVTALWNYSQNFAMNDNSFGTTFGPSAPGAINLIAGHNDGVIVGSEVNGANTDVIDDSIINDAQPAGDVCSTRDALSMDGINIGDELNSAGVTWGFFEGGFDLTVTNGGPHDPLGNGTGCNRKHTSIFAGVNKVDYIPHHQPFQFFKSTQNLTHARPSSVAMIGQTDVANHQYDLHDFFDAVRAGNFPAVSFLKAAGYEDGHAGYSTPLDEQNFVVNTINFLETRPEWSNTLVIINYDDSDGWYDHVMGPIVSQSDTTADQNKSGTQLCGSKNTDGIPGRCGYGPRLPYIVVSPFAKQNFVDHTVTDQSSSIRFIEDNWNLPRIPNSMDAIAGPINNMLDFSHPSIFGAPRKLFLDPSSGEPVREPFILRILTGDF